MSGHLEMGRNALEIIEARNELFSFPRAELCRRAGTHARASLAGRLVHIFRDRDRHTAGHRDRPSSGFEQTGPDRCQHNSNHPQPCALWIPAAGTMARRPRGSAGDSRTDSVWAAAGDPQYLHRNPWRRSGGGRGGTGHGAHRLATFVSGAVAAGARRDSVGCASCYRDLGGPCHHCGRDRRRRSGRVYFSRAGYGEQPTHPGGGDSSGIACATGRFQRGMAGEASATTMTISFQSRGNATRCRAHLLDSRSPLYVLVLGSILLTSLIPVTSCAPSHSDRVVVGSKNFTESLILGELMAQQIEAHSGVKVERRFYLAGTYICHQAA